MYRLVETIKIIDGVPQNLLWHQKRLKYSCNKLFGIKSEINLTEAISVPSEFKTGIIKARFLYNRNSFECKFSKYNSKIINSLKLIVNNEIDYSLKYTDRKEINSLFENRGNCDDILIIKNGRITDSSIANIVLYDGNSWITPSQPLLRGTCRERLISEGKIIPEEILTKDLELFTKFKLINALRDFEEKEGSDISAIR